MEQSGPIMRPMNYPVGKPLEVSINLLNLQLNNANKNNLSSELKGSRIHI